MAWFEGEKGQKLATVFDRQSIVDGTFDDVLLQCVRVT